MLWSILETNLSSETQADVDFLTDWFKTFEFMLLTSVKIRQTIDERNKILQSPKISVKDSENILLGLTEDIETLRDSWELILREAKTVASSFDITAELKPTRERKRKVEVFLPCLDLLSSEIRALVRETEEISKVFSHIVSPKDFSERSDCYINDGAEKLAETYPRDLNKDDLANELQIYYQLIKETM
ncbi:hypothetical protein JTB14_006548 [Gonioctena quinquepunctata]|nr:hypothetical protein JTB14_006548 [Gonioctena quinquepunctata]